MLHIAFKSATTDEIQTILKLISTHVEKLSEFNSSASYENGRIANTLNSVLHAKNASGETPLHVAVKEKN